MSGSSEWNDVVGGDKQSSGGGGKSMFLRLQAGRSYRIRPVGKPIEIWKYFSNKDGQNRSAICADPETCPVKTKYNLEPKKKYAINIIDREDGKLKVMEGPVSVFAGLKDWFTATGNNPGGKDGGDFQIKVIPGAGGNKKLTKYTVTFLTPCPFSSEEKEMLGEGAKNLHNLSEIFKPDDAETIEKKLFGAVEPKGQTAEASVVETQPAPKTAVVANTAVKVVKEDLDF